MSNEVSDWFWGNINAMESLIELTLRDQVEYGRAFCKKGKSIFASETGKGGELNIQVPPCRNAEPVGSIHTHPEGIDLSASDYNLPVETLTQKGEFLLCVAADFEDERANQVHCEHVDVSKMTRSSLDELKTLIDLEDEFVHKYMRGLEFSDLAQVYWDRLGELREEWSSNGVLVNVVPPIDENGDWYRTVRRK